MRDCEQLTRILVRGRECILNSGLNYRYYRGYVARKKVKRSKELNKICKEWTAKHQLYTADGKNGAGLHWSCFVEIQKCSLDVDTCYYSEDGVTRSNSY